MKINLKKYQELNEERAFNDLLDLVKEKCFKKLISKIGEKSGWESDPLKTDILEDLMEGITKHYKRIEDGAFLEDDLIDLINYSILFYNLMKQDKHRRK